MKTFWIRTLSATVYAALFLGSILSGHLVGETWGAIILLAFSLFACGKKTEEPAADNATETTEACRMCCRDVLFAVYTYRVSVSL